MKKIYVLISITMYLVFMFLFVKNIFQDFDLFYVFWGAIIFPLPLAFMYIYNGYTSAVNKVLFGFLSALLLVLLLSQLIPTDSSPESIDPIHRYITLILGFLFAITLFTSYVITFANHKKFDLQQIVLFVAILVGFVFCRIAFSKDQVLELVSGTLLFVILTYTYFRTFIKLISI